MNSRNLWSDIYCAAKTVIAGLNELGDLTFHQLQNMFDEGPSPSTWLRTKFDGTAVKTIRLLQFANFGEIAKSLDDALGNLVESVEWLEPQFAELCARIRFNRPAEKPYDELRNDVWGKWQSICRSARQTADDLESTLAQRDSYLNGTSNVWADCPDGGQRAGTTPSGELQTPEERALSLLVAHPDWTDKRIAEAVGVSRTTVYGWPRFKAARNAMRSTTTVPKGTKDGTTGDVEAWDAE